MSSPRPSTLKFLTHWKWDAPARESPPPSPTYGKAPLLPEALTGPASLQLCSAVPAHATLNTALTLPRSPSGASSAGLPEAPLPGLDAPGTPCAHSRVSPGLCPRRGPGVPRGPKAISGGKQRPTRLAPGHISGQKQPARLWRAAAPPPPTALPRWSRRARSRPFPSFIASHARGEGPGGRGLAPPRPPRCGFSSWRRRCHGHGHRPPRAAQQGSLRRPRPPALSAASSRHAPSPRWPRPRPHGRPLRGLTRNPDVVAALVSLPLPLLKGHGRGAGQLLPPQHVPDAAPPRCPCPRTPEGSRQRGCYGSSTPGRRGHPETSTPTSQAAGGGVPDADLRGGSRAAPPCTWSG